MAACLPAQGFVQLCACTCVNDCRLRRCAERSDTRESQMISWTEDCVLLQPCFPKGPDHKCTSGAGTDASTTSLTRNDRKLRHCKPRLAASVRLQESILERQRPNLIPFAVPAACQCIQFQRRVPPNPGKCVLRLQLPRADGLAGRIAGGPQLVVGSQLRQKARHHGVQHLLHHLRRRRKHHSQDRTESRSLKQLCHNGSAQAELWVRQLKAACGRCRLSLRPYIRVGVIQKSFRSHHAAGAADGIL